MGDLGMVDQTHLIAWADSEDSKTEFPRLIRRLILETAPGLVQLGMPAGEGVSSGGWDGSVKSTAATAWIPAGLSVWELSVNSSPGTKADDDYAKRGTTPDGSPQVDAVYVQGILRRWTKREEWARDRTAEKTWKEVRAIGLDDIETWLEDAPVTHAWISERRGLHPHGFRSGEAWWDSWSNKTSPSLPVALAVSGRSEAEVKVAEFLAGPAGTLTVAGGSLDEVRAFIVSTLLRSDDGGQALARTAYIDSLAAWRTLIASKRPLVLVPMSDELALEVPSGAVHHVIVPVRNGDTADLVLPAIAVSGARDALKAVGMSDAKAEEGARLARRSLMALRRHLATTPAIFTPTWAKPAVSRAVRSALLLGSWSATNAADVEVVSKLSGNSQELFIEDLAKSAQPDDPLLSQVGDSMHLVSPEDAWLLLRGSITAEDLTRLKSVVEEVLGEINPALDYSADDRWKAGLDGKVLSHSEDLRKGLARTMALLGINGKQVRATSTANGADWASHVVRGVLDRANADATGRQWASLTDLLPVLAEASPDAFLDAVTSGLRGDPPLLLAMFESGDGGPFAGFSPHTGLLWALERLAWSTDHFGAVVEALARLAEIDPGGRTMNRPAASLASIFCPWHPGNSADVPARLAALDGIRNRHGDASWALMLSMLPQMHGVQFPPNEPSFRDWVPTPQPVLVPDYLAFVTVIVTRMVEDVGDSAPRWAALIDKLEDLIPSDRSAVLAALQSTLDRNLFDRDEAAAVWTALRKTTEKHREFADAAWALAPPAVDAIEAVAERLRPASSADNGLPLFMNYTPNLSGQSRRGDRHAYQDALREARADALRAIDDGGDVADLRRLIEAATVYGAVGVAIADATGEKHEGWLLAALNHATGKELDAARSYFAVRFHAEGWPLIDRIVGDTPELQPLQMARLLLLSGEFPMAWERAESAGQEVARHFWTNFMTNGLGHDFPHVEFVADRLMSHGRNASALMLITMYAKRDGTDPETLVLLVVRGFQGIRENLGDDEVGVLQQYELESLFGLLEQRAEVIDADELGMLEWFFLPALGFEPSVPTLHQRLAGRADFFVEVVSMVYRRHNGTMEEMSEDEAKRRAAVATNGYRLLSTWTWPPGFDGSGIDADKLKAWVADVRVLLKDADRFEVGMNHIGQVLAAAPADGDGKWPSQVVRDVLESAQSEELERGFHTQVINERGVTSRGLEDGGVQERALVVKYRADADGCAARWPVTARVLRQLANSYEAESRRNEQSAERFRQGLEGD